MIGILAAVLALQTGVSSISDEAAAFNYVRQGRFAEFAAWAGQLPEDSPAGKHCRAWARRLAGIQAGLVEAINRGGIACDLKEVHPESSRGGRIVGATTTTLQVLEGERKRTLIWAALPARTSLALAERFLSEESKRDPLLLAELGEALGLQDAVPGPTSGWAADLAAVEGARLALGERSVAKAVQALAGRPPADTDSPSLRLVRLWLDRLTEAVRAKALKKSDAESTLPKGSGVVLFEDFEGGPEILSPAWKEGYPSPLPDGSTGANRWCLKSIFIAPKFRFGELVEHFDFKTAGLELPVLHEQLYLSCRIWGTNARTVSVILKSAPVDGSDRTSKIELPVDRQDQWNRFRVCLGDVTAHRPALYGGTSVTLVALGDAVSALRFEANRADPDRKEGFFCVDDLLLFSLPPAAAAGSQER